MTVGGEVNKTLRRRALTGDEAPAAYFGRHELSPKPYPKPYPKP
jgi:hypothetical protein